MPTDNTGENIGSTISTVGSVVAPIVATLDPPIGAAVTIAFKLLAVLEPAAYNAVAALISGADLTPEQQAEIDRVSKALEDPDSYLAS